MDRSYLFRDCIKIGANKLFFIQIKNCFTYNQNAKLAIFFTMNIELRCTLSYNNHTVGWPFFLYYWVVNINSEMVYLINSD